MRLSMVKIGDGDRLCVQTEAERELGRALALLEHDQTGSVTLAALRERGVTAPAQAVYDLQLAGYAIDRITSTGPGGRTTSGYRLRGPLPGELDHDADCRQLVHDDNGRQPDTGPPADLTPTKSNPKETFDAIDTHTVGPVRRADRAALPL